MSVQYAAVAINFYCILGVFLIAPTLHLAHECGTGDRSFNSPVTL